MKSGGFFRRLFLFTGFVTFIAILASVIYKLVRMRGEEGFDGELFEEDFEDEDLSECGYAHETDFEKE